MARLIPLTMVTPHSLYVQQSVCMNANDLPNWTVALHDRGHFVHLSTGPGAFGLDYVYKRYPSGETNKISFTVNQLSVKDVSYLDDARSPCTEEAKVDLYACVQRYLEMRLGCRLPWAKENEGGRRICDSKEDYKVRARACMEFANKTYLISYTVYHVLVRCTYNDH